MGGIRSEGTLHKLLRSLFRRSLGGSPREGFSAAKFYHIRRVRDEAQSL